MIIMLSTILKSTTPKNISCLQLLVTVAWWSFILSVSNKEGIYAIGDINYYPGKLKLILSGFHEAAIMCHSAYQIINPGKKNILKYTTVSGISGFDGTKKEPKKTQINTFK